MNIKTDIKELKENYNNTRKLVNEIAKDANEQILIAKHKIICQTFLIGLLAILGTIIAIYSVYSTKQLFYDMTVEQEVVKESCVEQCTGENGGSNYYINESDNSKVGE